MIELFQYLQDKDVYESFHKTYLAKRLLQNRSVSDEAERSMIGALCGGPRSLIIDHRVWEATRGHLIETKG